jgi:hypothetical protein
MMNWSEQSENVLELVTFRKMHNDQRLKEQRVLVAVVVYLLLLNS